MSRKPERFGVLALDPHLDCRGWVVNPFADLPAGSSISDCHAFSVAPGARRGNHAHPERDERVAVLAGSLRATDLGTGTSLDLSSDEPRLLLIAPGVPHVFENTGSAVAVAICFSTVPQGPDAGGAAPAGRISLR